MSFFFFFLKKRAILKAFKEDDVQRLGGSSSPESVAPVSYSTFE